jgi:hypothetical protein
MSGTAIAPFVVPANAITIREQVMEAIVALFQGMNTTTPADDPYPFNWDFVQRAPLDEKSWQKRFTLGVHDTSEIVKLDIGLTYRTLSEVCEYRCNLQVTPYPEDPSTMGNMILGALQRRLFDNNTLSGLVTYFTELKNEMYVYDLEKRQLSGAIFLEVYYRSNTMDPRKSV